MRIFIEQNVIIILQSRNIFFMVRKLTDIFKIPIDPFCYLKIDLDLFHNFNLYRNFND